MQVVELKKSLDAFVEEFKKLCKQAGGRVEESKEYTHRITCYLPEPKEVRVFTGLDVNDNRKLEIEIINTGSAEVSGEDLNITAEVFGNVDEAYSSVFAKPVPRPFKRVASSGIFKKTDRIDLIINERENMMSVYM